MNRNLKMMMAALAVTTLVTGTVALAQSNDDDDDKDQSAPVAPGKTDAVKSTNTGTANGGNTTTSAGSIFVRNEGGYAARFSVAYDPDHGKRVTRKTGSFGVGAQESLAIPAGATNIHVKVEENTGVQWSTIFTRDLSAPATKCYKVYGTTLQPKHKKIDCP